ncbi:MAG TPA: hypothetical protein VIL42_09350 [Sphingomicrobium sp.]|jgi:hypothetical protein
MRKVILSLAAAGAALVVASPASAQYFPQPQGYAYGYQNNYGQVRALQARVDNLQRQIERLDRREVIREREARRLRDQARSIERRLWSARNGGLSPWEANDVQMRLVRLEQNVRVASMARGGGYYRDRDDRDGRRHGRDRDRDDD